MCKDWRELSEAASREQDPKKLLELVKQLNEVLAEREENARRMQGPEPQTAFAPTPREDEQDLRLGSGANECFVCSGTSWSSAPHMAC